MLNRLKRRLNISLALSLLLPIGILSAQADTQNHDESYSSHRQVFSAASDPYDLKGFPLNQDLTCQPSFNPAFENFVHKSGQEIPDFSKSKLRFEVAQRTWLYSTVRETYSGTLFRSQSPEGLRGVGLNGLISGEIIFRVAQDGSLIGEVLTNTSVYMDDSIAKRTNWGVVGYIACRPIQ